MSCDNKKKGTTIDGICANTQLWTRVDAVAPYHTPYQPAREKLRKEMLLAAVLSSRKNEILMREGGLQKWTKWMENGFSSTVQNNGNNSKTGYGTVTLFIFLSKTGENILFSCCSVHSSESSGREDTVWQVSSKEAQCSDVATPGILLELSNWDSWDNVDGSS